jgi:ADP-heptose:LPS heptosyltransferase
MNKKIIFFSIDRLGDYLIRSNVIYRISQNFQQIEIIGSSSNTKLINTQNYFTKVYSFNLKNKFFEKIKFIKFFFLRSYDSAIVFDGKNISNILLILIRSNFKFTFLYKKKSFLNFVYLKFITLIYKILKIKYEIILSKDLIENNHFENYPMKYKKLNRYFSNINDKTYYLENNLVNTFDQLMDKFVMIHLDEKFADIKDIESKFENSIIKFQSNINKKIILTTFNNNLDYYKYLKIKKINFKNLKYQDIIKSNIIVIENIPIIHFHNLMKNSYANISCHSGLFVHSSIALCKMTIDIINESQEKWLNSWIDYKKDYIKIYKSTNSKIYNINEILTFIYEQIKKK